MNSIFNNSVVLITGGTGSLGLKFIDILLSEYAPKQIRIFSRGELLQQEARGKFKSDRLRFIIGDVRDAESILRATYGVDILIHAAALKQVPACETNPIEAIQTNINGSVNVIYATLKNGVDRVIGISSDKSCLPATCYGATKMVMEKLIIQSNLYVGDRRTKFGCVRYGNVAGSRGSIVPVFLAQKKSGIITITDARMTRFWFTLEQAVRLVISCIEIMQGGEIFVPIIPSIKIVDLASAVAPECKQVSIGIRPGEKLHEILLSEEEARHTIKYSSYFIIKPEMVFNDSVKWTGGEILPEGFKYTSDSNSLWLDKEELNRMVQSEQG